MQCISISPIWLRGTSRIVIKGSKKVKMIMNDNDKKGENEIYPITIIINSRLTVISTTIFRIHGEE
jgi:hypothetical protein